MGLAAFVLGVSLLLEGALYFGTLFTSSYSRGYLRDSFQSDWRDTEEFENFLSARLENLITMGAGGRVYGYEYYYNTGRPSYGSINASRIQAMHEAFKEDRNILYAVEKEGKTLYSSSDALSPSLQPGQLPEGYGFLLQFDGEKVRIWKDGEELDVYGDGYYRYDSDAGWQWYVPGYRNFTVDEAGSQVKVTMAVIDQPQVFIKGRYGQSGAEQYSQLYYIKQGLDRCRSEVIGHAARMGVGLGLFLLYLLLRRDKRRADQAMARWTGRVWFEVKVLLALALVAVLLPRTEYLGQVWQELTYSYGPVLGTSASTASAPADLYTIDGVVVNQDFLIAMDKQGIAPEAWLQENDYEDWLEENGYDGDAYEAPVYIHQETDIGTAMAVLTENGGWLLREYLSELSGHAGRLLALFWGLYLVVINDWRYNRRPWKRGVFALLAAHELKYPLQKRLSRMCGIAGLTMLLLLCELITALILMTAYDLLPAWMLWNLFLLPVLIGAGVYAWFLWRQRRLWADFGAVSEQAAAIRAGALERELTLQEDSELYPLADDLNHIRQGLHQAVEERTRSERMKVELVTNVSHDLKTPLTSILSYTELLAQEPLEPPASEYVQILGEKSRRLKAMVQDVFEVSKAASGQLPVKLEGLDYARLLRQTLADMAQAIDSSGLALRTAIPEEEVPILADSDRLYRVFQNLIGNALKYSIPGSRVYLTLAVEGTQATASVRNTSAAELKPGADYTARFVRGDESRTDGGSGLGLSIADSFTRACGGTLTVTTEADLFTARVTFPLAGTGPQS